METQCFKKISEQSEMLIEYVDRTRFCSFVAALNLGPLCTFVFDIEFALRKMLMFFFTFAVIILESPDCHVFGVPASKPLFHSI